MSQPRSRSENPYSSPQEPEPVIRAELADGPDTSPEACAGRAAVVAIILLGIIAGLYIASLAGA
jgi:hypothetical protein